MSDGLILEKSLVCLGRVTPTSWLSSRANIEFLLAEVLPAPVGYMSWILDNTAHFSSFSNCSLQIVGGFSLKWALYGFWHVRKQSSLGQVRVSTDGFELWPVSGTSEYFVRPFIQTILNMECLIINTPISYSWAHVVGIQMISLSGFRRPPILKRQITYTKCKWAGWLVRVCAACIRRECHLKVLVLILLIGLFPVLNSHWKDVYGMCHESNSVFLWGFF